MIEGLTNYLIESRLVNAHHRLEWSARLTGNWSIICFQGKSPLFYIKLEQTSLLNQEYETITYWHERLPKNILKPLRFGCLNSKQLYIQQAKVHRNLYVKAWNSRKDLRHALMQYFNVHKTLMGSLFLPDKNLLADWHGKVVLKTMDAIHQLSLPQIPQHGDLTLTNLGFDEHLFIFDWEDYGKCQYPLLDITTFMLSLCDFDMNKFYYNVLQTQDSWLNQCLSIYSCTAMQFLQCLPYSLAEFLALKLRLGYSEEVIRKTKNAISTSLAFNQGLFDA